MHRGATLKIRVLLRIVPPIQYVILNMAFKSARIPLARSPLARNRRFLIIDHRVLVNYRILIGKLALFSRLREVIEP
jgi:hypothetical protein